MTTLSFRIFLFTLAFVPLAFGTVEHWSLMSAELLAVASLCLCLLGLRLSGHEFYKVPGMLSLLFLLVLILLQLLPLPPALLKIVSPTSWEAYRPVSEQLAGPEWLPISVNQKATLHEFLRLCTYTLFYLLTVQLLRTGQRIKFIVKFVVILGGIIAFFAILQQFSSDGKIYWYRPAPGGNPGGPWVNVNQYSAYVELICPLALGLFLFYKPSVSGDRSFRQRIVSLFSTPGSNSHFFLGFIFILLVFSVFVSLCRGGIITILLSIIFFALLTGICLRNYGRVTFWISLCLALLCISWFGWQPIVDEFSKTLDSAGFIRDARTTIWMDTLNIIRDYPLWGSGFGTYVDVYPLYKTINTNLIVDHAHNDYLELLSNGGLLGFFLAVSFFVSLVIHGLRKIFKRRDRFAILMGVASLTSLCAVLIHCFVDFNLHNGAIGFYFFFLCGLFVAVVNTRYNYYETNSLLKRNSTGALNFFIIFSCGFLVVTAGVQIGTLLAGWNYRQIKSIYITSHLNPSLVKKVSQHLEKAMFWDPLEGRYPFYRGNLSAVSGTREQAYQFYLRAARNQPMNGIYIQRTALMLPAEDHVDAAELMAEGYRRALNKDKLVFSWVEWLLANGERDQAKSLLKKHLLRDPAQSTQLMPILDVHRFTSEELLEVLPPDTSTWIKIGGLMEQAGDLESSAYYRTQALEFINREKKVKATWFEQLIQFHKRHGAPEKALAVTRKAIEVLPDYAPFHIWLGDYYRKEKILYRAQEEYEQAVLLDPRNDSYRRRLNKLKLDIEFGN